MVLDRVQDRTNGMYTYFFSSMLWGGPTFGGEAAEQIKNIYGVGKSHTFMIKNGDYHLAEPYGPYGGTPVEDPYWYSSNAFYEESYGGNSALLYMDLTGYADTDYFAAYIKNEQARAAYTLAYMETATHNFGRTIGKAMTYSFDLNLMSPHYKLHLPFWGSHEPTEEELDEFYEGYHAVQWDEMTPDISNCNATIWGVSGEEAEPILENAEGTVDMEAYLAGEECVLVLPDTYFTPKPLEPEENYPPCVTDWDLDYMLQEKYENRRIGFYDELKSTLFPSAARLRGYEIFSENTIQPGDVIPVKFLDEVKNVRVGAILRTLPDTLGYPYTSLTPFTIITDESFFRRFETFSDECAGAYECVTLELDGKQADSVVELQINATNDSTLTLSNLAGTRQSEEQDLWMNISAVALFAVLYFAVLLVVLSLLFSLSMENQRKRIAVLRALGMESSSIRLSYILESLLYSIVGFLGAVPVLLIVWGTAQGSKYGLSGPWLSYIISNGAVEYKWWIFGLLFLAVAAGVLGTLYLPLRKFFKDTIISQMQE